MKKVGLAVFALLTVASLSLAAPKWSLHKNGKDKTFTGVIMDSQCAMMGSHEKMEEMHQDKLQAMGVKASNDLTGKAARACTLMCVKQGGKFVLYNKATKTTYKLDDQEKPRDFAGERVKVTGTYDPLTMTIHVASIRKAIL